MHGLRDNKLKKYVLSELRGISSVTLFLSIDTFASSKKGEVLRELYNRGVVTDTDIEEALKHVVTNAAQIVYKRILNNEELRLYPDTLEPHAKILAYAIEEGILNKEAISKIHFDHDETPEEFCKRYGGGKIIKDLKDRLLNPRTGKFEWQTSEYATSYA